MPKGKGLFVFGSVSDLKDLFTTGLSLSLVPVPLKVRGTVFQSVAKLKNLTIVRPLV